MKATLSLAVSREVMRLFIAFVLGVTPLLAQSEQWLYVAHNHDTTLHVLYGSLQVRPSNQGHTVIAADFKMVRQGETTYRRMLVRVDACRNGAGTISVNHQGKFESSLEFKLDRQSIADAAARALCHQVRL
jgi:hypothetical protein